MQIPTTSQIVDKAHSNQKKFAHYQN